MNCEERIRELEQELRELKDAWKADVEHHEERITSLEEDCCELQRERDEWYDRAEEWKQRAYDYESERDIALKERNEALERVRELEEELGDIKPKYKALLTIFQEELGHLETLIARAEWERARQHIAHIRRRYHAAIAIHALQNQNTPDISSDTLEQEDFQQCELSEQL